MSIEDIQLDSTLQQFLKTSGICDVQRAFVGRIITNLVSDFISGKVRPKWLERSEYDDLKHLSAPNFMKLIYADLFEDGVLRKSDVRANDPVLMAAVESYISTRLRRKLDYGDATGLQLISTTRPPNSYRRQTVITYKSPRP